MTDSEANAIDLLTEESIVKLKELVQFWQDKALSAEIRLNEFLRPTDEEINDLLES